MSLRGQDGQLRVYPPTRRVDQIDRYHDTDVADPYRWLEADIRSSEEVAAWAQAQNAVTENYLARHTRRSAIRRRLTEIWDFERQSTPMRAGDGYAFFRNDGLQNHSVLFIKDSLQAEPRLLIDPNLWSQDGTIALTGVSFSKNGRYVAYTVSESGSDWQTWKVINVPSGQVLEDELKWVKFGYAAWTNDGAGFYYHRFEEPDPATQFTQGNIHHKVYYHRIGDPQEQDVLVYERPDHPEWKFACLLSDDGRYLIIVALEADDDRLRILYKDLMQPGTSIVELIDRFELQIHFIGSDGPVFYFMTDRAAPRRRIIAIDTRRPEPRNWQEIVPEGSETQIDANVFGKNILTCTLKDVVTRVRVYTRTGDYVRGLELPAIGSATGFTVGSTDAEVYYSFSSFTIPPTIYRCDLTTGESAPLWKPETSYEQDDYEVKQVFFHSKDGTRVPMFVSHKRRIKLDGSNPTLLYGYGGYGFSLKPWFSISAMARMEAGGVYAVANVRGGGEYGRAWHHAAYRTKRQNAFDDFIAAAEWLIDNRYTRSEEGGSNGGLLVAAVLTQRPDLFGAFVCDVPMTDMLRFPKFDDGPAAVTEFGSPEYLDEFRALFAYSPYHNVKPGAHYPPTLVTTGDTDDRLVPMHSFKFVAALQHAQVGSAPVLLLVEQRAGHGGNNPTATRIEELTDLFAFLAQNLDFDFGRL